MKSQHGYWVKKALNQPGKKIELQYLFKEQSYNKSQVKTDETVG